MPQFIIRETTREIWKNVHIVEAETQEEALRLYYNGDYYTRHREYYDTVDSEAEIKENLETVKKKA